MHCHCGTNNNAPRWTFTDPCKSEVRLGAREESASLARLSAPAMNARDTTKVYIWRLDTGCGPSLYRKSYRPLDDQWVIRSMSNAIDYFRARRDEIRFTFDPP